MSGTNFVEHDYELSVGYFKMTTDDNSISTVEPAKFAYLVSAGYYKQNFILFTETQATD